jgi:hypothetical protein
MNYELAKELKEAGFPTGNNGYFLCAEGKIPTGREENWDKETAYVPTLEELIEACGDMFGQLVAPNYHLEEDPTVWVAMGRQGRKTGATKTEAVARLWLKINKK